MNLSSTRDEPGTPKFPSTWIDPDEAASAIERGRGRGIKVAIIDSGVDLNRPELRHLRLIDDIAFEVSEFGVVESTAGRGIDVNGHGTAVAYVLRRAAPEVQLGSFRILDDNKESKLPIVAMAAKLAIDRGYHILNCSIGSPGDYENIQYYKPWVDYAYKQGVHVVSACNNGYFRDGEWPGTFPSVITVNMAKTQQDDLFFRWDCLAGVPKHLVEFAARGVNVEVPWKGAAGLSPRCGSSYAAPHVGGLLACLLSIHPRLKPLVAKCLLQEVAKKWTRDLMAGNS